MKVGSFAGFIFLLSMTFLANPESIAQERGFDPEGFTATFYDRTDLLDSLLSKPYTTPIDFCRECFGENSPFAGCKLIDELADGGGWSVRWQGMLIVPIDGEYTFTFANVDDGTRLILDGDEVVDKGWYWPASDKRPPPQAVSLNAGKHEIRIDYEQRVPGAASLQVRWAGPNFEDEVIPIAGPPPFSTSFYLTSDILIGGEEEIDHEKLQELGCFAALKGRDAHVLVILDFGEPDINANTYGAYLNFPAQNEPLHFLTTSEIRDAAISFLEGYWECSNNFVCARLTLAIGTKNDRLLYDLTQPEQIKQHGISWAMLVNEVDDWIKMNNRSRRLEVAGAIDLERWPRANTNTVADPEAARLWVEAFVNSTDKPYYNYGNCENCPTNAAPPETEARDWGINDYWYLSWGVKMGQAYPVPEIYSDENNSSTHARQWRNLLKYAIEQCGEDEACRRLVYIPGILTQCQIVDPFQDEVQCRTRNTNMPVQGWRQLYDALLAAPETAHAANLLRWSSDIINLRQYKPVVVSVDLPSSEVTTPQFFILSQNYPNPFNPITGIRYSIPKTDYVILKVYNLLGKEIETLVSEVQSAGEYEIQWNPVGLPSGAYVYRLQVGENADSKKLILLK